MIGVDVRVVRREELPALVAAFGQQSYFDDRLARQERGLGELLVAWRNGVPVGDVSLIREPVPEPEIREHLPGVAQISHLEVSEAQRRQGIGSALLAAAERLAFEHGHGMVVLGCGVTNPVRPIYDGRGYDDWGHGTVVFRWADAGPDGVLVPDSELCHVLVAFTDPDVPPLTTWAGAWDPAEAARQLAGAAVSWAVAGGWAVDLHLGRITRDHSDLEIALPRSQFGRLRPYLKDFDLYDVGPGLVRRLGPRDEPDPDNHQVWVAEAAVPTWRMDTFLEPGDGQTWVSHRDPRVRMPLARAIHHTEDAIPYLAPEIVVFTKAKHTRDKDVADLEHLMPTLDQPARAWLAGSLLLVHPGHPWSDRLAGGRLPA